MPSAIVPVSCTSDICTFLQFVVHHAFHGLLGGWPSDLLCVNMALGAPFKLDSHR